MRVHQRRRRGASSPRQIEKGGGTELVEELLALIERHRGELGEPRLMIGVLGCVVANAVDEQQAFAQIDEVAELARLAIETAGPLNRYKPKAKDKPIEAEEAQEAYAQEIRTAVTEAISKVGGASPESDVAVVNYFGACIALADVIGALMASDASLPEDEFKGVFGYLQARAVKLAEDLREGAPLDADSGYRQ
jgi:hypothetical protein